MMSLEIPPSVRRVLCIGAHCDDVEIGCGGTLLALAQARPDLELTVAVFASDETRAKETRAALAELLGERARLRLELATFRNSYFPGEWTRIKERIEALRRTMQPDLVLTHCREDLHQDHRVLGELTWNAFREHWILEYEIPKYDGDLGRPTVYVPLDARTAERKIDVLLRCFASQAGKPWFTAETFRALMRLRGIECQAAGGYAEAFYSRKLALTP